MILGLVGALAAAVCYGAATVLQAVGVRRLASSPPGSGLLVRATRAVPYAAGLALDGLGFLASLASLRSLPLFVVESAVASSVAVTALLAVAFLGARLGRTEVVALVVIGVGLIALAASATSGPGLTLSDAGAWLLLVGVLVPVLLALPVPVLAGQARRTPASPAARSRGVNPCVILLAVAAGLGFGGVGIAARVLQIPNSWWHLIADPVAWSLAAYAVVSLSCYALALARGSVTVVAALTFTVETVVPAGIGLAWLGDRVRPGFAMLAFLGFVATVGGCVALAGRAELIEQAPTSRSA